MALADKLELNADPWPIIDRIFTGVRKPPQRAPTITNMFRKRWERIKSQAEKMDSLKLLARLELTVDQAERALAMDENAILTNPYVLFENDRTAFDPISFGVVDRGPYPGKEVATAHPLPAKCNGKLVEYDNEHRLRAACVEILENSTQDGHTFLPVDKVKEAANELSVVNEIPLDKDTVDICRDDFGPVVAVTGKGDDVAVQLDRYVVIDKLLTSAITDRMQNAPKAISVDWRALVNRKFGPMAKGDADEDRARTEKAVALQTLAANRVGMLIGPAGTGKTTVIQPLVIACRHCRRARTAVGSDRQGARAAWAGNRAKGARADGRPIPARYALRCRYRTILHECRGAEDRSDDVHC